MGLKDEYMEARAWVVANLTLDQVRQSTYTLHSNLVLIK